MTQLSKNKPSAVAYFAKRLGPPVVLGFFYYLWIRVTGLAIPCLFHAVTGLDGPGCGTTRLCLSLLRGDFLAAKAANPFVFFTLPFLLFEILFLTYRGYLRSTGKVAPEPHWNTILLGIYAGALILFGILRNLF